MSFSVLCLPFFLCFVLKLSHLPSINCGTVLICPILSHYFPTYLPPSSYICATWKQYFQVAYTTNNLKIYISVKFVVKFQNIGGERQHMNYTGLKVMLTHETWLKCLIYNCSSWLYCSENKFLSLNMINTDCLNLLKVFKELCDNRFVFFHFLDMQAWMSSFKNIFGHDKNVTVGMATVRLIL